MADAPTPAHPDVGEIFRPHPEEQALDRGDGVSKAALFVGPTLVVLGIAGFILPIFGEASFLFAIVLLALAPGVLSLGWRPGGSTARARAVTAITAALLTLAAGGLGLLANPCAYDPVGVALTSAAMTLGTFVVALALGRALVAGRWALLSVLGPGVLAFGGFFATAYMVLPKVFTLC